MIVLEELLKWSQERPSWQRDALRRLVQSGDLSDDERDQQARDFTLKHVPQNLASYPMRLREKVMPVRRDSMKAEHRPPPGQLYGNW